MSPNARNNEKHFYSAIICIIFSGRLEGMSLLFAPGFTKTAFPTRLLNCSYTVSFHQIQEVAVCPRACRY